MVKYCIECKKEISEHSTRCKTCSNKSRKGKFHHSDETKKNLSEMKKGEKNPMFGKIPFEATKRKISGENNVNWKGGIIKQRGYIFIKNRKHPFADCHGYVKEHRLVMEKHLGRYLTKKEIIHHLDFNKANNNINNLHLFHSNKEHSIYHAFLIKIVRSFIA